MAAPAWLRQRSRRTHWFLLVMYLVAVSALIALLTLSFTGGASWERWVLILTCTMPSLAMNLWLQSRPGPSDVRACGQCRGHGYVKRTWHDLGSGAPCADCRGQGFQRLDGSPAPLPGPRSD